MATIDIARLPENKWSQTLIGEIMSQELSVGYADETLYAALTTMTKNNISHLPMVDRNQPDKLLGFWPFTILH